MYRGSWIASPPIFNRPNGVRICTDRQSPLREILLYCVHFASSPEVLCRAHNETRNQRVTFVRTCLPFSRINALSARFQTCLCLIETRVTISIRMKTNERRKEEYKEDLQRINLEILNICTRFHFYR